MQEIFNAVTGAYLENDFRSSQKEAAFREMLRAKMERFESDQAVFDQTMRRTLAGGQGMFSGDAPGSPRDCEYHKIKIAKLIAECNHLGEQNMKHKENNLKLKEHAKSLEDKLARANGKVKHLLAVGQML